MKLPAIDSLQLTGKQVLVRADLEYVDRDSPRGQATEAIVDLLKDQKCARIKLIGHKGLPVMESWWPEIEVDYDIRRDSREMDNSLEMAEELSRGWDVYINESFAESHRPFTSVNALPRLMKSRGLPVVAGRRFCAEIEHLSRVLADPRRPLIFVISGLKEDKLSYVADFAKIADKLLIAGRLPEYIEKNPQLAGPNPKLLVAKLLPDKEDVTINSIESFEAEIAKAGTIVLSGPVGKYEEEGHQMGTERIFKAIGESAAFKLAGGGDTTRAIQALGLTAKFDWISVGGGAMLEFLAKGSLPAIEVLTT